MKKSGLVVVIISLAALSAYLIFSGHKASAPTLSNKPVKSAAKQSFDKRRYSTDLADSLWAVVNKGRALPADYSPADLTVPDIPLRLTAANPEMHLRASAAAALEQMAASAKKDGVDLMLASGYRPYDEQVAVYNAEVKAYGQAQADRESARPGHSEHQTGLAADLEPSDRSCELADCFADTPAGKWLAANAYHFGFIIRYPQGDETLTGYRYEPWHVRYLGTDLANQLHASSQTLEQFFDLPAITSYPATSFQLRSG